MEFLNDVMEYIYSNPWLAITVLLLAGLAAVRIFERLWGLKDVEVKDIFGEVVSALTLAPGGA